MGYINLRRRMQDSRAIWHAQTGIPRHRHFGVGKGRISHLLLLSSCWRFLPRDAKDTFLVSDNSSLSPSDSPSLARSNLEKGSAQAHERIALPQSRAFGRWVSGMGL